MGEGARILGAPATTRLPRKYPESTHLEYRWNAGLALHTAIEVDIFAIVVTECGIANLRGRSPYERAMLIIQNCAHPDFRDELNGYLEMVKGGHTPHTLTAAFKLHEQYLRRATCAGWTGGSSWGRG